MPPFTVHRSKFRSTAQRFVLFYLFLELEQSLSGVLRARPFFCESAYDFYLIYILLSLKTQYPPPTGAWDADILSSKKLACFVYGTIGADGQSRLLY